MISPGTILINKDAPRPECFQLESDSHSNDWGAVKHTLTAHELENELTRTGWTFFYMANAIRTTAFGFDRAKMIEAALKRFIVAVRLQKCNCLEIDDVETHSFLGIPYVSLSGHARHIQLGMRFAGR